MEIGLTEGTKGTSNAVGSRLVINTLNIHDLEHMPPFPLSLLAQFLLLSNKRPDGSYHLPPSTLQAMWAVAAALFDVPQEAKKVRLHSKARGLSRSRLPLAYIFILQWIIRQPCIRSHMHM